MVVYGGEEMTMRWMMDGMKVPIEVMLVLFQESIPVSISQYFTNGRDTLCCAARFGSGLLVFPKGGTVHVTYDSRNHDV